MNVLAGSSKGVFSVGGSDVQHVLESGAVRDLVMLGERLFAGTGDGLFASDDAGASPASIKGWPGPGRAGYGAADWRPWRCLLGR